MSRHQFINFVGIIIAWCSTENRLKFGLAAILTAWAQLLQTVALFLPIKVLILLGGGSTSLTDLVPIPFDMTIVIIASAVPILYALSILSLGVSRRIIVHTPMPDHSPFKGITRKNFTRWYATSIDIASSTIIIFIALFVILLINLPMALLGACAFGIFLAWNSRLIFYNPKEHYGPLHLTPYQVIDFSRILVFLALFVGLAVAVVTTDLNVYIAILALLVSRQAVGAGQALLRICHRERKSVADLVSTAASKSSAPAQR